MTTLHVIDAKSLAYGHGRPTTTQLMEMAGVYGRSIEIGKGHRVIAGCNPGIRLSAQYAFPEAQVVTGHGPDGADLALIEALQLGINNGWGLVFIESGDWKFAELAHQVRTQRIDAVAVSRPACLSRRLRDAVGKKVRFIRGLRMDEEAA